MKPRLFTLASALAMLMCATGVAMVIRVLRLNFFWRGLMLSHPMVALEVHVSYQRRFALNYYPAFDPPHFV